MREDEHAHHPDEGQDTSTTSTIGKRYILPASFTGGPRYMYQQYQDAMAIVREYGKPDLFITMTCNPNWVEITENIRPHQSAQDRPDIVARVWQQKLRAMLRDLDEGVLGVQVSRIYVIEFQKRGLPHAYLLMILRSQDKPSSSAIIDRIVSAEIPDPEKQPLLYSTVVSCMMHGPCGVANPQSPCMKENKCSKRFPKEFSDETRITRRNYPVYKRRRRRVREDDVLKHNGKRWDNKTVNQWVVPYNPYLAQKYDCHINVEVCTQESAVKYVYRYVYKGADKATVTIEKSRRRTIGQQPEEAVHDPDEITRYLKARYISPIESCLRLLEFPTQGKTHSVVQLAIHLPEENYVSWREGAALQDVLQLGQRIMLLAFFEICTEHPDIAGRLLYQHVTKFYRWDSKTKKWVLYKKHVDSVGRVVHVSPLNTELFYLRLILCHRRGPRSFQDLLTVGGRLHDCFRDAAQAAGYMENDNDWDLCLTEAVSFQMPYQLRQLFVTILVYSMPNGVKALWKKFQHEMSHDFQRRFDTTWDDRRVQFLTMKSLDSGLKSNSKMLADFLEIDPQLSTFPDLIREEAMGNTALENERAAYNEDILRDMVSKVGLLNSGQRYVYDRVTAAVRESLRGRKLFFIDGPGGTGKSFLIELMLATVRLDGKIALAVASSGIAALLLSGGKTAHSTFKMPIKLDDKSTCAISKQSDLAGLLRVASLIIWDEAPMTHRHAFEAVNRTLCDLMDNMEEPIGGKIVVLPGDFRQILPVVKDARGYGYCVDACLKKSVLWAHFHQLYLTEKMRILTAPNATTATEIAEFSDFLLSVGEGRIAPNLLLGEHHIRIPDDVILQDEARDYFPNFNLFQSDIQDNEDTLGEEADIDRILDAIYGDLHDCTLDDAYFAERAILTPRNEDVRRVNENMAARLSGEPREFLSVDSVYGDFNESFVETEFLHSLNPTGIPPHKLTLKVGAPIMMIRNLNCDEGLCNGTRFRVVALHATCIQASIMTGSRKGQIVFIPRITFITDDDDQGFAFQLRRKQFPIIPAFAMTINKSQGQSIHHLGLYLPTSVFAHGQLYVALSRVTARHAIKIVIENGDQDQGFYTKNIVHRQIFE